MRRGGVANTYLDICEFDLSSAAARIFTYIIYISHYICIVPARAGPAVPKATSLSHYKAWGIYNSGNRQPQILTIDHIFGLVLS